MKVKVIEGYTFEDLADAFNLLEGHMGTAEEVAFDIRIEEAITRAIISDYPDVPPHIQARIIETASIMLHTGIFMGENKKTVEDKVLH
jgi:hypothetical protein